MKFENASAFFEKIFAEPGKIIALPAGSLPARIWRSFGAVLVSDAEISPRKSVFENISAPLAATGTPWEIAQARIDRELNFVFGKIIESNAALSQTPAEETDLSRVKLAAALVAKPNGAPLVVSGRIPAIHAIFGELRERAAQENFAVVVENADFLTSRDADLLAFFPHENDNGEPELREIIVCTPTEAETNPEALCVAQQLRHAAVGNAGMCDNTFSAVVLGAGAGEFFAEISSGTQIHGKLCGNLPDDLPAGAIIEIFLPPEIFHLDAFPPEENFFELAEPDFCGEIFFDGRLYYRQFKTRDGYSVLRVAAQHRQALEIPAGGTLYAWFFPEDALGFPATAF